MNMACSHRMATLFGSEADCGNLSPSRMRLYRTYRISPAFSFEISKTSSAHPMACKVTATTRSSKTNAFDTPASVAKTTDGCDDGDDFGEPIGNDPCVGCVMVSSSSVSAVVDSGRGLPFSPIASKMTPPLCWAFGTKTGGPYATLRCQNRTVCDATNDIMVANTNV